MIKKIKRYFSRTPSSIINDRAAAKPNVEERVSDDVLFRMALFTGTSLENIPRPFSFRLCYHGESYRI